MNRFDAAVEPPKTQQKTLMLLVEVNVPGEGWTPFALRNGTLDAAMTDVKSVSSKRELRDTRIRRLYTQAEVVEANEQMESFWA